MFANWSPRTPNSYFYPDQYNNDANWQCPLRDDGPGNLAADGRPHHPFRHRPGHERHVHGRRPGGCKELNPAIQCISMQPDGPLHGLEGMKHMPTALVPGIYDPKLVADEQIEVATEDAHRDGASAVREEGLLVGVSSGANMSGGAAGCRGVEAEASSSLFSATRPLNIFLKASGVKRLRRGELAVNSGRVDLVRGSASPHRSGRASPHSRTNAAGC